MKVWVTRAQPGADQTADRLRAMGHEPMVAPLLAIEPIAATLDLAGVAALAFTSRNGVAAFVKISAERDLPTFTAGDATAAAARGAGFLEVSSAAGDVQALATLIVERREWLAGTVLHVGAQTPAGDLAGLVRDAGVAVRSAALYRTLETADATALGALATSGLAAVLIHSPRAGRRLADFAAQVPPSLHIAAISEAAAEPLRAAGLSVDAAPFPSEAALLKLLANAPGPGRP